MYLNIQYANVPVSVKKRPIFLTNSDFHSWMKHSFLFVDLIFLCVFRTCEDRRDGGSTRPRALQCWWVHTHYVGPKEKFNTTVSPFQLMSKLILITWTVAFTLG